MTPVDEAQQQRFLQQIVPAASAVCPRYGIDPKACIMAAAVASSCGRFSLGHNWWGLHGTGDAGYYTAIRPVRTYAADDGGWVAEEEQIAKFSSPHVAVEAWCRAQAGG